MGGHRIVPLISVGYFRLIAFRFTQFIETERFVALLWLDLADALHIDVGYRLGSKFMGLEEVLAELRDETVFHEVIGRLARPRCGLQQLAARVPELLGPTLEVGGRVRHRIDFVGGKWLVVVDVAEVEPDGVRGEHARELSDELLKGVLLSILLQSALFAVVSAWMARGMSHLMEQRSAEGFDIRELVSLRDVDLVCARQVECLVVRSLDYGAGRCPIPLWSWAA